MHVDGLAWTRNWTVFFILANMIGGGILIGLGSGWNYFIFSSKIPVACLPIVEFGVVICGAFLEIVSLMGIIGVLKRHSDLLLYYIVGMSFVFIALIGVATACLTMSDSAIQYFARQGWQSVDDPTKHNAQVEYQCCGFEAVNDDTFHGLGHPPCFTIPACTENLSFVCNAEWECCSADVTDCSCTTCKSMVEDAVHEACRLAGQFSRAISLLMMIGPILAGHFRNNHCDYAYHQQ